jgi:hypothetical protein
MFFNTKDETILRETNENGPVYQYVMGHEKEDMSIRLNDLINKNIKTNKVYLRHSSRQVNTVEEAISKGPMYCNFLKTKGYKNILFVGHFNNNQTSWFMPFDADRNVDLMPPERAHLDQVSDPNIVLQFIPMIWKMFGYKGEIKVCSPSESRHRGIMHSLYRNNGLKDYIIKSNKQYRHGMDKFEWNVSLSEGQEKFDAVVFLGVPKNDGAFAEIAVKECFSPICTPDFDLVDMYYNQGDSEKFVLARKKDNTESLTTVFSNRSEWDSDIKSSGGRPEEYMLMDRIISVY